MVACAAISKRQDMYKYSKKLETTRYVQIRQKSCFLAFLQAQYTLTTFLLSKGELPNLLAFLHLSRQNVQIDIMQSA